MGKIFVDEFENYILLPNYHLTDKSLSYKAKGMLSVMLNFPESWNISQAGMLALTKADGDAAVRSGMKELINAGYVVRNRAVKQSGGFGCYRYVIIPNPNKIECEAQRSYKMMPNDFLRDQMLSYKAKGIIATMLNLPSTWEFSQNTLVAISNSDGIRSVRSGLKELVDAGYIEMSVVRDDSGKLTDHDYNIHASVESNTVEKLKPNPLLRYPHVDFVNVDKPQVDNPQQLNNIINKLSNNKIDRKEREKSKSLLLNVDNLDFQRFLRLSIDKQIKIIKSNVDYNALCYDNPDDQDRIDEIIQIMADAMQVRISGTIKISGNDLSAKVVQERFMSLRAVHVQQVLINLGRVKTPIRNMHSYLLTSLYQSYTSTNNQISQEILNF